MAVVCPYPDCDATAVKPLPGGTFVKCGDCSRLAIRCADNRCQGVNRPFMRVCCQCGENLEQRDQPAPECHAAGNADPVVIADFENLAGVGQDLDCHMVFTEGILFLQFPNGWIAGLHPFCKPDERQLVLLRQPGEDSDSPLFPPQVVGSTLIVANRRAVWQLPLVSLWDSQWQKRGRLEAKDPRGPEFRLLYQAPGGRELLCTPVAMVSNPKDKDSEIFIFLLLDAGGDRQEGEWTWLRVGDFAEQILKSSGFIEDVALRPCRCFVLGEELVGVANPQGHWLLEGQPHTQGAPWEDADPNCVRTLNQPLSSDEAFGPASVVFRETLANDKEFVRWFFLNNTGKLSQYTARFRSGEFVTKINIHAVPEGDGVRPVGEVTVDYPDRRQLLCISDNELRFYNAAAQPKGSHRIPGDGRFRHAEIDRYQTRLIWGGATPESHGFGYYRLNGGVATLAVTRTMPRLRAVPAVVGEDLLALCNNGELLRYEKTLTYP